MRHDFFRQIDEISFAAIELPSYLDRPEGLANQWYFLQMISRFSETIAQITLMSLHGSLTLFRAKIKKIFVKAT